MSQISIHEEAVAAAVKLSKNLFEQYRSHWVEDGENRGMNRPGYSAQESEAHQATVDIVRGFNVQAYQDLAGNTYIVKPGRDRYAPVLMSGSHLDAVPKGGAYDGPAGVVIAVSSIMAMEAQGIVPPQDYVAVAWRNEESTSFGGQFGVGAKLALGQLSSEFVKVAKNSVDGQSLETHMRNIDIPTLPLTHALKTNKKLLDQDTIGRLVEFHIEQGDELAEAGNQIGFVDKVRASLRFPEYIRFHGEAGHTGSLPMHKRKSAGMAMSEFIVSTSQKLGALAKTMDLVYEPSIIETPEATQTSVVKEARVKFDIRSTSKEALEKACQIVQEEAVQASHNNGCTTNALKMKVSLATPQEMSGVLRNDFVKASEKYDIPSQIMVSGANHDVCSFDQVKERELIFLRHAGGSHNPDEQLGLVGENSFVLGTTFANAIRLNTDIAMTPANDDPVRMPKTFGQTLLSYGAQKLNLY